MRSVKSIPEHPMLVSEFAKVIGITDRKIRDWIQKEDFPVMAAKDRSAIRVNGPEAFNWMVEREIKIRGFLDKPKGANVVDIDVGGIAAEKLRKTRAERIKLETANRLRQGEILEASDVRMAIEGAFVLLKNLLDGLAGRLSGGNAVKRKKYLTIFRDALIQYQGQLRSCYSDPEFVEVTPPAAK